MKYSIDRIEENRIILENIETKEKRTIKKTKTREDYKEGMILIEKNGRYKPSKEEEEKRRKIIEKKVNEIKNCKEIKK